MITISGKSVFGGVAIGKLLFYQRTDKVMMLTQSGKDSRKQKILPLTN